MLIIIFQLRSSDEKFVAFLFQKKQKDFTSFGQPTRLITSIMAIVSNLVMNTYVCAYVTVRGAPIPPASAREWLPASNDHSYKEGKFHLMFLGKMLLVSILLCNRWKTAV